jgi:hypothetical protein
VSGGWSSPRHWGNGERRTFSRVTLFIGEGEREEAASVLHVCIRTPVACRSGRDAARAGCERLPCPCAADGWAKDQFQTIPDRCCPLGRTVHRIWSANKCFAIFPNGTEFVNYENHHSDAPKFTKLFNLIEEKIRNNFPFGSKFKLEI